MIGTGLVSLLLELSGKITFATLGLWGALRIIAFFSKILGSRPPKFFPISAQRQGFSQSLGAYSVVVSEAEYNARLEEMNFLQRLAKTWWPLITTASVTQFVILFGAKGLAFELEIPFWLGLGMSISALLSLGFFRRRMIKDHLRETDLPEGKLLDWDSEAYLGGMRVKARFDGRARKVILNRLERNVLAKDGSTQYYFHGLAAKPDSVHRHGDGLIVSEFRMLDTIDDKMTEDNWTKKIKLKDAIGSVLSAYIVANELELPVVALLEYPGAILMITPMAEHVDFFESVG